MHSYHEIQRSPQLYVFAGFSVKLLNEYMAQSICYRVIIR